MDHQPHDPTDWWKRGQSSLSESNQYSKHLSFESAMAGVHDSKRNKESYNQQEHHECPQNNDRPAKKVHPNAFFVFSSERRQKIRDEQPNIRNSDLNRLLGQEWNSLSEGSKMHYKQRSDLLKEKVNECIIPYSIPVSIISSSNGQRSSEDEDNAIRHPTMTRYS
ncbi:hypothetical protein BX666DRAFT_1539946 [Dichotomocladium elegans]|nr:hypothetical protein BX666DRAFT_1539946 [Dichotomocladium elegans]